MLGLSGPEVLMLDGTVTVTEITSEIDGRDHCLSMLLKMYEYGGMMIGFDIECSFPHNSDSLLTLGTQFGCLLIKLDTPSSSINGSLKLRRFLSHKDIIFAGVHFQEDVKRLWERFKLEIRNVVDLSELAADVLHQPRLRAFGMSELAHEVLSVSFKARHFSMISIKYSRAGDLPVDQIECASTDAYAAYKIA